MLGRTLRRGKDTFIILLRPCVMRMLGPNNVGRRAEELCKRIQVCCATLRRLRNKRNVGTGSFWLKSLTGLCATTPSNTPQIATTCNIVYKRTLHVISNYAWSCWPTMLRPFARGLTFVSLKTYLYPASFSCRRPRANQRT